MKKILVLFLLIGLGFGALKTYETIKHDMWMTATVNAVNSMQLPDGLESD